MQTSLLQVGDCVESLTGGWQGTRYHHPDRRHVVVDCDGREGMVQSVDDSLTGQTVTYRLDLEQWERLPVEEKYDGALCAWSLASNLTRMTTEQFGATPPDGEMVYVISGKNSHELDLVYRGSTTHDTMDTRHNMVSLPRIVGMTG